jgi:vacuolar-type H+-ATPase subunit H
MTDQHPSNDDTAADAAIDRVLTAEARARDEINHCRRQALAILREARSRARGISRRADRRIGRVRRLSDTGLKTRLDRIAEQSLALSEAPRLTAELQQRLDRAIDRLIDEILE